MINKSYWLKAIGCCLTLCALFLVSCEPQQDIRQECKVLVHVYLPDSCTLVQEKITFEDRNMGKTYRLTGGQSVGDTCIAYYLSLPAGFYSCTFDATVRVSDNFTYPIRAYEQSVSIKDTANVLEMHAFDVRESNDFVLAEIFFAGTETPEGKRYIGDKYFVVFNNSADTLAADGLILLEADLNSVQKYDLGDHDFRNKYFAVDAMYRVPGNGKTYRVAPGQALLIADNAMNHKEANSNSFDLSTADMEWYDVSSSAGTTDVDNPDIPNMDKLYCYTYTIWVPHNQGHKSFALARFPEDVAAEDYFATDSLYVQYNYEIVTSAGTYSQSKKSYMIPNEWIVDGVNLAPSETFQWLTLSNKIDAGYAYVAPTGSDVTRFGKAVRRKTQEIINGRRRLQDTNNSTEDFEMAVQADPFYFKN